MGIESRIFQSLEGLWKIQRTITNFGKIEGIAKFSRKEDNELHYEEKGKLFRTTGEIFDISRRYIYRFEDEKISVYFVDAQRLFHTLAFINPNEAHCTHFCVDDKYSATYKFIDNQTFSLTYQIEGPKKNNTIFTIFTKNLSEPL